MKDKCILIVEDRGPQRRFIGDVLRMEGCQVFEAENNDQAKEILLKQSAINLLVLDQMVPGMTGTDFIKCIQTESELLPYKNIPAILLTAYPENKDVRAFQSQGGQVLSKPLQNYQDLLEVVNKLLK